MTQQIATEVITVPQLQDNFSYLVINTAGEALIIDPSDPAPIENLVNNKGLEPKFILNTHHHDDHTRGNLRLKETYALRVFANNADAAKIPGFDEGFSANTKKTLLGVNFKVLGAPGHTSTHLLFYFEQSGDLFTGDTLFLLGCGRVFEGHPEQLFASLQSIASLPTTTRIWCGHEYTLKNALFAESILGTDDADLKKVAGRYRELNSKGLPTVPGVLADELKANPFFRTDEAKVKKSLGLANNASPLETFCALRERRNSF